jgi:hypothetical protein
VAGAGNAYLLCHFIPKMIVLPRQARDKHRERTQNRCAFSWQVMSEDDKKACEDAVTDPEIAMPSLEDLEAARWAGGIVHPLGSALPDELPPGISGAKKPFVRHFHTHTWIFLPRQARDNYERR